jgi:hypothetical protein
MKVKMSNIKEKKKNIKTQHFKKLIDEKEATFYYELLRDNIKWDKGVKTKNGKDTRLAKNLYDLEEDDPIVITINQLLEKVLSKIKFNSCVILGEYINYYLHGDHYTPNHSHPKMIQVIISLGTTRTLNIGKKEYKSSNSDVFIFGSSIHGIKKEPEIKDGRISIALFCSPM